MRKLLGSTFALVLVLGLAACSSDGDEKSASKKSTTTTTTTIPTLQADEVDASASPYCAAWADIREAGGPTVTGDPKKDTEERKQHYGELLPLVRKLVETADDEIKDGATFALHQVEQVAKDGSAETFSTEESAKVQQELAAYALEHCSKD